MKKRKLEPAVQTIVTTVPAGTSTADLSQMASLVNRRFYRQGINWVVAGFRVFKPNPTETGAVGFLVSRLPNTWVMGNAWEKSFRHWQELNKRATEAGESLPGRFTDFKVYMDSTHHTAGSGANLLPLDASGNAAAEGEWEYSKIVFPQSSTIGGVIEVDVIATGPNYPGVSAATTRDAVSLIEGYAASRALPSILDPNTPGDASDTSAGTPENWLGAIDNEGTTQVSEVLADLTADNDKAPYPFENDGTAVDTQYPGGANQLAGLQLVDAAYFSSGTNSNKLFLKGDNFPCGLVRFVSDQEVTVCIDLVPGTHRGYLCEPMTEM